MQARKTKLSRTKANNKTKTNNTTTMEEKTLSIRMKKVTSQITVVSVLSHNCIENGKHEKA